MKIALTLISFTLFVNLLSAQDVSCSELVQFIEQEGWEKGSLNSFQLDSEWLYSVTAYSYDYKTFVVAEIKQGWSTNTYIFCGVPDSNWNNFSAWSISGDVSYGERFHRYIMDYTCNCY